MEECIIDMAVPTGAMGNITGGYMAKQMGVPIGNICACVNINGKNAVYVYILCSILVCWNIDLVGF